MRIREDKDMNILSNKQKLNRIEVRREIYYNRTKSRHIINKN